MSNIDFQVGQLRATLGKMAIALGTIEDAIVWTNGDGQIKWCNAAFERLVGRSQILLLGTELVDQLPLQQHDQVVSVQQHPLTRALTTQRSDKADYQFMRSNSPRILEVAWAFAEINHAFAAGGAAAADSVSAVLVLRDVTQQRLAAHQEQQQAAYLNGLLQQLQLVNAELAHANQLKDKFLAMMSHELRTPLNAILGITQGLQDQVFGSINDEQLRALGMIESSGFQLLELINDILDLTKIDARDLRLNCQPTAVLPLCESSLALIKPQAGKKQLQITLKLAAALPDLLVDEQRIRHVLVNLLSNAVKFTPNGGRITLEVSRLPGLLSENGMESSHRLRIAVIDTGIGIAPEHLSQLFQPFVQLDSALNRQYEGTGLGLALVQRIVELHDGQVAVTSQVGVGSCFTIDLPCVAMPMVDVTASPLPVLATPVVDDQRVVILIAEDNPANISTVSNYLEAKGYRMVLAADGEAAIALTQTARPDLILMDLHMPGVNGLEAIACIRSLPDSADIPIIVVTALTEADVRDRCFAVGATDYLPKPIQLKQLLMTIERCLECRGRCTAKCDVQSVR